MAVVEGAINVQHCKLYKNENPDFAWKDEKSKRKSGFFFLKQNWGRGRRKCIESLLFVFGVFLCKF